jgi:hypothetical protein
VLPVRSPEKLFGAFISSPLPESLPWPVRDVDRPGFDVGQASVPLSGVATHSSGINVKSSERGWRMSEIDEQRGDGEVGRCHVCGREFASQEDLSKHLMDAHDEDLLPDAEREA